MSAKKKSAKKFVPFAGYPKWDRPTKEQTRAEIEHLRKSTPGTMTDMATAPKRTLKIRGKASSPKRQQKV